MPELPEVQTIVDDLNKKIKGDVIVDFWSDWPKTIKSSGYKKFKKDIKNKKIEKAWRKGKNIFIDLSGGKVLYLHLKMTGHLLVKPKGQRLKSKEEKYFSEKVNQYIHHIWYLKSKNNNQVKSQKSKVKSYTKTLEFSDLRKFGKIVLVEARELEDLPEIKRLGVDAVNQEFTLKEFKELLGKKLLSPIGVVLMNQDLISGIGNIYRSEILFDAKINPKRKVNDLKEREIKRIFLSIGKILKKALKLRGTSDSDYRDTSGAPGSYQKVRKVYRKEGEACPTSNCKGKIKREKLAQRSVFYCSSCQK